MTKKTKLTRTLMAACSVVALSAVMYGCSSGSSSSSSSTPVIEQPAYKSAVDAAKAAAATAKMKWQATRDVLAGIAGMMIYNPAAYARVQYALADANTAYEAAMAASAAAQTAKTSADAKRHQATAEARKMDADTANTTAMRYAQEAKDVPAARTAAAADAKAAKGAYDAAVKALADVEAIKADAPQSYDTAKERVDDARKAHAAAMLAATAAEKATTSAGAKGEAANAMTAKTSAETAKDDAIRYAGMVTSNHDLLTTARTAAATAATAAMTARDAAQTAVDDIASMKGDDGPNHTRAGDRLRKAKDAYNAAESASAAAVATTDPAEAARQRKTAEDKKAEAEAAKNEAVIYAGRVADSYKIAQAGRDNAAKEKVALDGAKTAAMTAAAQAKTAADEAKTVAAAVEGLLGANAPEAVDAKAAADAAKKAADAAEVASVAADAATTSVVAIEQRKIAENERKEAEAKRDIAKGLKRLAEGRKHGIEQARISDLRDEARIAKNEATSLATAALSKATAAQTEAAAAHASATKALAARTDYVTANGEATAARNAAAAAVTAAATAATAKSDAITAYTAAMAAGVTVEAAELARDAARAQSGIANTESEKATTELGTATTAAMDARKAADTHVLSLFTAANAYDVLTSPAQNRAEVERAGVAIAEAAARPNGNQAGNGTTAVAAWPFTGTTSGGNFARGELRIKVDPEGMGAVTSRSIPVSGIAGVNAELFDAPGMVAGLRAVGLRAVSNSSSAHGFDHGFDMWGPGFKSKDAKDGLRPDIPAKVVMDTENIRVIAFTDIEPPKPATGAQTGEVLNMPALADRVVDIGVPTITPLGFGSVSYDHDGLSATQPLLGTLACPGVVCTVTRDPGSAGVLTISGYQFSGNGMLVAATLDAADTEYLIFGIWLNDPPNATPDAFGAFAIGSEKYKSKLDGSVKGMAHYTGPAFGAHHLTNPASLKADRVSWFHGDAKLAANFDDTQLGTFGAIQGDIRNIVVDGENLPAVPGQLTANRIQLQRTPIGKDAAGFEGLASLGRVSAAGLTIRQLSGTWSGFFYGDSSATSAPGSVAGTFGVTAKDGRGTPTVADDITESFVGSFGARKE